MSTGNIELLDSVKHRNLRIDTRSHDYAHNHVNIAAVTVGELGSLIHEYPIFVNKNPNTGQFQLSAILGFESGQNLFLTGGVWRATYMPLDIQRRPFAALLNDGDMMGDGRIAIDVTSKAVKEQEGERLFDDDGKSTAFLERIKKIFSGLMFGTHKTREVLAVADKHDLLQPVTVDLKPEGDDADPVSLGGLYALNKESIAKLGGDALKECCDSGCLEVCYLVGSSAIHLDKLMLWQKQAKE